MGDDNLKNITPRDELARRGLSSVGYLTSGVFLLAIALGSAKGGLVGMILSVIAITLGSGALLSKDRDDKKPGFFLIGAGLLGMIFRFVAPARPFAGFLLGLGVVGFFAAGVWKGIKFLLGLKSRQ